MKCLAFDIATTTGYALVEDQNLKEYGTIQINSSMTLLQKLNFLSLEIKRIIEKTNPDCIAIEDIILAISGVRVAVYLARLNGVALHTCYSALKENIHIYTPDFWKAHSFPNLNGHSKKWQIQVAACKYFSMDARIDAAVLAEIESHSMPQDKVKEIRQQILSSYKEINKAKTRLKSRRTPITDPDQKKQIEDIILSNQKNIEEKKKEIKNSQKIVDKEMMKVSVSITASTGISPDIADACGLALCAIGKNKQNDSN